MKRVYFAIGDSFHLRLAIRSGRNLDYPIYVWNESFQPFLGPQINLDFNNNPPIYPEPNAMCLSTITNSYTDKEIDDLVENFYGPSKY